MKIPILCPPLRFVSLSALGLAFGVVSGFGQQTGGLDLVSPKDGAHFDVSKPLFFWRPAPGATDYQLMVDGTDMGDVPAAGAPLPVMSYGLAQALTDGTHQWSVKAVTSSGTLGSGTDTFTIDPPTEQWPAWAIGPFQRYGGNPLVSPQGTGWESHNTFNPGVIFDQGKFRMLYRAQGKAWTSREGYAESADGVTFTRDPQPIIDATESFEKNYGAEDARFFHYQDTYYAFYTGNNPGGGIALCEATSPNGTDWKKLGVIVPHAKNGAMICDPNGTPVKINGKFSMFTGNSGIGVVYSDDLVNWSPMTKFDMNLPKGWVRPWEPCVAVTDFSRDQPDNVVLFIAGTLNGKGKWFYAISEALFSKTDLTKKVDQLDDCIMKPREPYESGQNRNCLWTNCIIQHNGQWMLYYGAGDRYVALATAPVK
jgi:predicted GH43/DUF377 family glycosyl hydrolase